MNAKPEFLSIAKLANETNVSAGRVRDALAASQIEPDAFVTGSELRAPQPLFQRDRLDVLRASLLGRPVVLA